MTRLIIAGVSLLGIMACASTAPETTTRSVPSVAAENSRETDSTVMANNEKESDSPIKVVDIPQDETVATVAESEELVCRRVKKVGTHRTTKVCRTRGQIDAERESAQKNLREHQMRTSGAVSGE